LLAFRIPGYRWLWFNSFFGASGFSPYHIGEGWLILELTDSPLMVGLAPAIGAGINMVFSPFGGVLVDRFDRRKVLTAVQMTTALAIATLGVLTVTEAVHVWQIFVVSAIHRLMMGLQLASRNTLMYDVVGRQGVMNAMAGQFMSSHSASVVFPLGAGVVMASMGTGALFLFIGGIIGTGAMLVMRVPKAQQAAPRGSMLSNLGEAARFAFRDRPVRNILWTVLITDGLGFSTSAMFPVLTRDVLHAGELVLGLISTIRGVGGVVGALVISGFGDIKQKGRVFVMSAFCFGATLVLFAISREIVLSLSMIFLVGVAGTVYDTMAHTLLQTASPEAMRGRMMGLYAFVVSGIGFGSLAQGAIAAWIGVTWAIAAAGSVVSGNALGRLPVSAGMSREGAAEAQKRAA
jgi:MFS family permease